MSLDFAVIGAQKSASTFIQGCLSDHPEIKMLPGEISFLEDPDYNSQRVEGFLKLEAENVVSPQKLLGLKRPNYLGKSEVPARLYRHSPDVKLVAVLRNPIRRAISAYYHNIKNGFIPVIDIEEGLSLIVERELEKRYPRSIEVLEFGLYAKHLAHYLQYFDISQFTILFHDDIVKAPEEQLEVICNHLDISKNHRSSYINERPQAVTYSIPRLKWLSHANKFRHSYYAGNTRLRAKQKNSVDYLALFLLHGIDNLVLSKLYPSKPPTLSRSLSKRLIDYYYADIEALSSLLDKDMSQWLSLEN